MTPRKAVDRALLLWVAFILGGAGSSWAARLALIPPENSSGDPAAPAAVEELLADHLASRGWEVVRGPELETELRRQRLRRLDSFRPEELTRLAGDLRLEAVLTSTIWTYRSASRPMVAISARAVAGDGSHLWSDVVGVTPEDTESALGFGRAASVQGLVVEAANRLMDRFPRPGGGARVLSRVRRRPPTLDRVLSYRVRELPTDLRLCVLPFENHDRDRSAPRTAAELLANRLTEFAQWSVVEPAELRAALRDEKVATLQMLDSDRLRRVADRLATPYFLRGQVRHWREGTGRGPASPRVGIALELVELDRGELLWEAYHERSGADYEGLFRRGEIGSVVVLASQVFAEMVASLADPASTSRSDRRRALGVAAVNVPLVLATEGSKGDLP